MGRQSEQGKRRWGLYNKSSYCIAVITLVTVIHNYMTLLWTLIQWTIRTWLTLIYVLQL